MDLRSLQYFITVAQELNFTRAAEKLQMSQPPLSNQIKALVEKLGVQLFIRGKRRLTLTEVGTLLLQRAIQMVDLAVITAPYDMEHLEGFSVGREQRLQTTLVREFIGYVRDFIEADLIHTPRFQVREAEYQLPEDTKNM